MGIDGKLDYLALMLNKRTNGKRFENFIVNAIYSKIGEPGLVPVTQQCVRGSGGRHYLLDLYFPQLNIGVEVDELQHASVEHSAADALRAEDIMGAIECDEKRIQLCNKSYDEVMARIDEVVIEIKQAIKERGLKLEWLSYEELLEVKKNEGCFKVSDSIKYIKITDFYNMLGHNVSGVQRSFIRLNRRYFLWTPILSIMDEQGNVIEGNDRYHNWFSSDKLTIFERKADGGYFGWSQKEMGTRRVVFMNQRDEFGRRVRKFVGVYEPGVIGVENVRSYNRVADEISFEELMPDVK